MNSTVLIGNLTKKAELRHTQDGSPVLNIRMATNEFRNNQKYTEFHNVVLWGPMAERLDAAELLPKGRMVVCTGRMQTRSYDGQDGIKRYTTELVAFQVLPVQLPPRAQGEEGSDNAPPPSDDDYQG